MSVIYKVLYLVGFTPWDRSAVEPAARAQILRLFATIEEGREPPLGKALDLGCGRGFWAMELTKRGWEVTGVDLVSRALDDARATAAAEGLATRFIEGDITALAETGAGTGYDLLMDFGAGHGLDRKERAKLGDSVNAAAAADATLLMLAWPPGRRWPLPGGLSRKQIEATYPGWTITATEPLDVQLPWFARKDGQPNWYVLKRSSVPG